MRWSGIGARGWSTSFCPWRLFAALFLCAVLLCSISAVGWPGHGGRQEIPSERYVIALAPLGALRPMLGRLEHPINFGYRCTLVDAASVLDYYGADTTQFVLALLLSNATDYAPHSGPPWWAYVAPPGQRPLLDVAIERVAESAGVPVRSQTHVGLNFAQAVAAIARDEPVILNVARTPDGTLDHSLLAIGFDTRAGHALLLVLDPNTQSLHWVGPGSLWSTTITSTFITPLAPPGESALPGLRVNLFRRAAFWRGIALPRAGQGLRGVAGGLSRVAVGQGWMLR